MNDGRSDMETLQHERTHSAVRRWVCVLGYGKLLHDAWSTPAPRAHISFAPQDTIRCSALDQLRASGTWDSTGKRSSPEMRSGSRNPSHCGCGRWLAITSKRVDQQPIGDKRITIDNQRCVCKIDTPTRNTKWLSARRVHRGAGRSASGRDPPVTAGGVERDGAVPAACSNRPAPATLITDNSPTTTVCHAKFEGGRNMERMDDVYTCRTCGLATRRRARWAKIWPGGSASTAKEQLRKKYDSSEVYTMYT